MLRDPKRNTLIVRKVSETNRKSTFPLMKQIISQWKVSKLFKINESEMKITCQNGSEIVFSGSDDPEKIKSITFSSGSLTNVWVEEASELDEADVNQLDLRLRGQTKYPFQLTLSFNPILASHWLKSRFFDKQVDDCSILKTTYLDNNFIDDTYKKVLESYKETDPYYYMVYCLKLPGQLKQS